MKRGGKVTIRAVGRDFYDIHIFAPWRGRVRITLPNAEPASGLFAIVHQSGRHSWRIESNEFGITTIWVNHLSLFGTLKTLLGKATCLIGAEVGIARCLLKKGIGAIAKHEFEKLVGHEIHEYCPNFDLGFFIQVGRYCHGSPPPVPQITPVTPSAPAAPSPVSGGSAPGGSTPSGGGSGGSGGGGTPTPGGGTPPPPPRVWLEQETPNHPVNTFLNYHNASGMGPAITAGQWVEVSCKMYDPFIASVNPDGYWYRIASAPWSNAYYSPANTFMNGDPYGGPYTHNTDFAVQNC